MILKSNGKTAFYTIDYLMNEATSSANLWFPVFSKITVKIAWKEVLRFGGWTWNYILKVEDFLTTGEQLTDH